MLAPCAPRQVTVTSTLDTPSDDESFGVASLCVPVPYHRIVLPTGIATNQPRHHHHLTPPPPQPRCISARAESAWCKESSFDIGSPYEPGTDYAAASIYSLTLLNDMSVQRDGAVPAESSLWASPAAAVFPPPAPQATCFLTLSPSPLPLTVPATLFAGPG